MKLKNYIIDIDGTIGDDVPNEESERMAIAAFFPDALETINSWYDFGHTITFFTARTESLRQVTEEWLIKCGFKYHSLIMGKPRGGNYHYIDNLNVQATKYEGVFSEMVTASRVIEIFPC